MPRRGGVKQLEVLRAVAGYIEREGLSPTVRDLCGLTGKTRHALYENLSNLRKSGLLAPAAGLERSLRLTAEGKAACASGLLRARPRDMPPPDKPYPPQDDQITYAYRLADEIEKVIQAYTEALPPRARGVVATQALTEVFAALALSLVQGKTSAELLEYHIRRAPWAGACESVIEGWRERWRKASEQLS